MYEFIKSPNFWPGRKNYKPEAIVIHITDGNESSVINTFTNQKTEKSCHYLVCRSGKIVQFVEEKDTAWHAGKVRFPVWKLLKQGVNPNYYTIGIEFEGYDNQTPSVVQGVVAAWLINQIANRWGIPVDKESIVPHNWIDANKVCPGKGINTDALAWLAKILK